MNPDNPNFRTPEEERRAEELVKAHATISELWAEIERNRVYGRFGGSSRPLSIAYLKQLKKSDFEYAFDDAIKALDQLIEEDLDQWFDHGVKKGHADALRVLKGLQNGDIRASEIQSTNVGACGDSNGRSVRQGDDLHAEGNASGSGEVQAPHEGRRSDDPQSDDLPRGR